MERLPFSVICEKIREYIKERDGLEQLPTYAVTAKDMGFKFVVMNACRTRNTKWHDITLDYCVRENIDIKSLIYKAV
jgi:hypothetical protein